MKKLPYTSAKRTRIYAQMRFYTKEANGEFFAMKWENHAYNYTKDRDEKLSRTIDAIQEKFGVTPELFTRTAGAGDNIMAIDMGIPVDLWIAYLYEAYDTVLVDKYLSMEHSNLVF